MQSIHQISWLVAAIAINLTGQSSLLAQSNVGDGETGSGVSQPNSVEWPRFLGQQFDSAAAGSFDQIDWSREPEFMWSIDVGDGYGIGSVSDGRYYQCDAEGGRGRLASTGAKERLRCFDLATGELIWSKDEPLAYRDIYQYEEGPRSSPTIEGDRVVTYGVAGRLVCRQKSDGEKLWEVDTNGIFGVVQNFFGVGSSPLVVDGRVIVMVGGSPIEDQDIPPGQLDRVVPNGSAIVAFDLETGKELWKCGDDLASYSSPRTVRVGSETLILALARGGLLAVEPESGRVRWRFDHRASILESVNAMVPVVDGDHVLISECYQVGSALLEISGAKPSVVWQDDRRAREKSMKSHWSTPVLVGDYLYGCSGRNAPDSDFRCIEFKTGEVKWVDPRKTRASVTRCGEYLVVMEERGALQVLRADPAKLDVVAQWDLSESSGDRPALRYPCWSAPVVIGDQLIVRGDRRVLSLRFAQRP